MASDEDSRSPGRAGHGDPVPTVGGHQEELSLLEVFNLLLKHRYGILGCAGLVGALALGLALVRPLQYAATSSFIPQGSETDTSRLAMLAGQFGVSVPSGGEAAESPAFYQELLRSREILGQVARDRYTLPESSSGEGGGAPRTLPEILGIDEDAPELRTAEAIDWLRDDAIEVRVDSETGMVTLAATTRWPDLSYQIASRLVALVNEFNLETRQSQAAAEREFIEGRLAEANDSLLSAENRLEAFLQSNRQFENSPDLVFQHGRLDRQVARAQEIVTSLSQSYEEARVSEVRNTPVITVVESPERPSRAEPRSLVLMTLLGLILGGMLGVFLALGRELLGRERARGSATYREFSSLWQQTWRDVRTLGGRLG
jgi:uncharacterized protein involved in exopolysaccharide biosynthesis